MAMNVATEALPKPALAFCKKCMFEHEKPVGTKCERSKNVNRDIEKRDSSRENTSAKRHQSERQLMVITRR